MYSAEFLTAVKAALALPAPSQRRAGHVPGEEPAAVEALQSLEAWGMPVRHGASLLAFQGRTYTRYIEGTVGWVSEVLDGSMVDAIAALGHNIKYAIPSISPLTTWHPAACPRHPLHISLGHVASTSCPPSSLSFLGATWQVPTYLRGGGDPCTPAQLPAGAVHREHTRAIRPPAQRPAHCARRARAANHVLAAPGRCQRDGQPRQLVLKAAPIHFLLPILLPLVPHGMPSSPYRPWCHVAGTSSSRCPTGARSRCTSSLRSAGGCSGGRSSAAMRATPWEISCRTHSPDCSHGAAGCVTAAASCSRASSPMASAPSPLHFP